jgi:hypothetical protein
MTEESADVRNIARQILHYLERYPEAKDTLDGIAQWWLQRQERARWRQDVARAVAWLCAHDLIRETRRLGVPPYYQRNPQQGAAIARILMGA